MKMTLDNKLKLNNPGVKIAITFLLFTAAFTGFRSLLSGVFSLYYVANGVPKSTISSIKSFQSIGILIGLLPSGILADSIGRLKTLALSSIVISASFILLVFGSGFIWFSFAELFYGIGLALNSGTLLAYVTGLQEEAGIAANSRLMGRQVSILNLATLIGGNIGTWLFGLNITYPVWLSIIGLLIYPVFMYTWIKLIGLHDNKSDKSGIISVRERFESVFSVMKVKSFWTLLLINTGFDCGTQFIMIYWSILYVDKLHFNLTAVYTMFIFAVILGAELFNIISTSLSSKTLVLISNIVMIMLFILAATTDNRVIQLLIFLAIEVCMGVMSGEISALSNQFIYGYENKSQFLSTVSFTSEILVSLSLFLDDFLLARLVNLKTMFLISAIYLLLIFICVPHLKEKRADVY